MTQLTIQEMIKILSEKQPTEETLKEIQKRLEEYDKALEEAERRQRIDLDFKYTI